MLVQLVKPPEFLQYLASPPPSSTSQPVLFGSQPAAKHPSRVVQGNAQVPLLSSSLPDGQVEHVPLSQLPLQHWSFLLQFFPLRLHPGGSADASAPMPSDPSVPPTRAAPINLSALPREMLPLASPLASSSKELSIVPLAIGCILPERRD